MCLPYTKGGDYTEISFIQLENKGVSIRKVLQILSKNRTMFGNVNERKGGSSATLILQKVRQTPPLVGIR